MKTKACFSGLVMGVAMTVFSYGAYAGDSDLSNLRTQLFKLQAEQEGNQKQFTNAMGEIKKIEAQLPELNDKIDEQIQKAQDNTNKMLKQLKSGLEEQLAQLNQHLNKLKEEVSNKSS